MILPNPYEAEEILTETTEGSREYNRLLSSIDEFLKKGQYKDYALKINKQEAPGLPWAQMSLYNSLWVSLVCERQNDDYFTHELRIKPRSLSKWGQFWDSFWGWK